MGDIIPDYQSCQYMLLTIYVSTNSFSLEQKGDNMFPSRISTHTTPSPPTPAFMQVWKELMQRECHNHSVWQTEFVRDLKEGDPIVAFQLAEMWSINMVAGSYCFPRYVAALASRAEEDVIRHGLLENAWDESGSYGHTSRSHFWLAVKLAKLLGLSEKEIEDIKPIPEAQHYTDLHFKECAKGNFSFALGMICLIEEFTTPEFTLIFKTFLRTCREGLGINSDDFVLQGGAEYFTANIADDERHREEMPRIVATWLASQGTDLESREEVDAGLKDVRAGVRYSADLRERFFNGIYRVITSGGTVRELYQ